MERPARLTVGERLLSRLEQCEDVMVNWRGRRQSDNVEDRRGEAGDNQGMPFPMPGGRGGIQLPGGRGGGMGIIGILIVLAMVFIFGVDPRAILGGGDGPQFPMPKVDQDGNALPKFDIPDLPGTSGKKVSLPEGEGKFDAGDDTAAYIKTILADNEDVWNKVFQSFGQSYRAPQLVLFSGMTQTACGPGQSMMGPFYCPLDQKVYIDLSFYDEMRSRFGAPGDFAQAYVVAHEVGHHVQKLLGIADKVQAYKQQLSERDANNLQVRMELQADCLAGVWANQANATVGLLQEGDIEEGLRAATAIGDDRLQKQATGRVVPDAFTHGSSEQRVRWLRRGLESGNIENCDTFNIADL